MRSPSNFAAVARAVAKPLLRAARALDARGATPPIAWGAPIGGAAAAVRAGFRAAPREGVGAGVALDAALRALGEANASLAALTSVKHVDAPAVNAPGGLSIGAVFVHRVLGYRGVILGWDARCRASGAWVTSTGAARLPHGTEQRFYRVLVDARDRPGQAATISYVAEDNVLPSAARDFVVHPSAAALLVPLAAGGSGSDGGAGRGEGRRGLGVA